MNNINPGNQAFTLIRAFGYTDPVYTTPQDSMKHIINGDNYMKYLKYALAGLAGLYVYNKFIK